MRYELKSGLTMTDQDRAKKILRIAVAERVDEAVRIFAEQRDNFPMVPKLDSPAWGQIIVEVSEVFAEEIRAKVPLLARRHLAHFFATLARDLEVANDTRPLAS